MTILNRFIWLLYVILWVLQKFIGILSLFILNTYKYKSWEDASSLVLEPGGSLTRRNTGKNEFYLSDDSLRSVASKYDIY